MPPIEPKRRRLDDDIARFDGAGLIGVVRPNRGLIGDIGRNQGLFGVGCIARRLGIGRHVARK